MKYSTAEAFRTALEHRLAVAAANNGRPIAQARKLVVFDRLLTRLQTVAPDCWFLKGGVALAFRLGHRARATLDLDLARRDGERLAIHDLGAAAVLDLGDGFSFDIQRMPDDSGDENASLRFRATASLAGRLFDIVAVDVGFGDDLPESPERIPGPPILDFAGLPPPFVPILPSGIHLAEKLHAYTRVYAGGRPSSRVRDLVDMALMASALEFEAGSLRYSLEAVFTARAMHRLPAKLPPPPLGWARPYQALAAAAGLEPDIASGHARAAELLDPILSSPAPAHSVWIPGGRLWR